MLHQVFLQFTSLSTSPATLAGTITLGRRWDRITLFVNTQGETGGSNPPGADEEGLTYAIWGPWGNGAL